jgi:hypothetical protein
MSFGNNFAWSMVLAKMVCWNNSLPKEMIGKMFSSIKLMMITTFQELF